MSQRMFMATMSYDVSPQTPEEARRLLRAELVGRRWQDRCQGAPLPGNTLWIRRAAGPDETTDHLHTACARELVEAAEAVAKRGLTISVTRSWIFVSGAGTYGPAPVTLLGPSR